MAANVQMFNKARITRQPVPGERQDFNYAYIAEQPWFIMKADETRVTLVAVCFNSAGQPIETKCIALLGPDVYRFISAAAESPEEIEGKMLTGSNLVTAIEELTRSQSVSCAYKNDRAGIYELAIDLEDAVEPAENETDQAASADEPQQGYQSEYQQY